MAKSVCKYFVCTNKDGCRLSDLNLSLSNNQLFERDIQTVEMSRSTRAAINAGWIEEISKTKYEELLTGKKKTRRKRKVP